MNFLRIMSFALLGMACLVSCGGSKNTSPMSDIAERDRYIRSKEMAAPNLAPQSEEKLVLDKNTMGGIPNEPIANNEKYTSLSENSFKGVKMNPLSTFSIDVDNASYSNIRRYIKEWQQLPPTDAVRIEEMINYFDYEYPQPTGEHPFSITTEIAPAPWNNQHHLIHIGLQGKSLDYNHLKPCNLVFLIDASGSMADENKLPLLKKSLGLLLNNLKDQDRIAIVAYAGSAGLVLPSTRATEKSKILAALNNLEAGGSTAGGEGIELAYKVAKENLIADGNNRVILATDGDFNVGVNSDEELVKLIEEKRKDDIYLTILGLGMGNYNDGMLESVSNAGNGNYFYIDNMQEAEKVFVKELRANLFTIAKDVKLQIEFNPNKVKAYRLIGYENRMLENKDFEDDKKDAGELGAGHSVTAIYEVVLADSKSNQEFEVKADSKEKPTVTMSNNTTDLMNIKFRYKPIKSDKSVLLEQSLSANSILTVDRSSNNFRFSAAVAGFGMLLRDSKYKGSATYDLVAKLAQSSIGTDVDGYRKEMIELIKLAPSLKISANN